MACASSHATGSCCTLYTCCTSLRLLACEWPRTLHPPPVEYLARPPPSHPWLGAPGPRHAIAVHRPTHRRAARAGDIACSTHCRELWRRAWSSPRAGTACLLHEPGNGACRLQQLLWDSPSAGTACRLRAHCSEACRRLEPTLSSHCVGTACLHRAHYSAPCRLEQT